MGIAEPVSAQSLFLERRIELPSVRGRIDHLAVDVEGHRLFIAALGSDSLEVVDLRVAKRVGRITSLHEPQGLLCQLEVYRDKIDDALEAGHRAKPSHGPAPGRFASDPSRIPDWRTRHRLSSGRSRDRHRS